MKEVKEVLLYLHSYDEITMFDLEHISQLSSVLGVLKCVVES